MSADVHYEIYVRKTKAGGWQLAEALGNRGDAMALATELIESRAALAVRVFKESFHADTGDFQSLRIHEAGEIPKEVEQIERPVELPCFRPQDLYSLHARHTIARVLKDQLAHWRVTTMELLHRADLVEKLEATGTVLQHAVQKVAVAHSGSTKQPVQEVVRKLNELIKRATERLYKDDRAKRFPKLSKDDIGAVARAVAGDGDAEYLLGAAIASTIKDEASFRAKLGKLLACMNRLPKEGDERSLCLTVVDNFVAEMVSGSAALAELIGNRDDLGASLLVMADLFLGASAPDREVHPGVEALAAEFKRGGLPNARAALAQRIMGDLRGVKRLCPDSLEGELDISRRLAMKMVMGQGKFLSIDEITEAFALRSKRLVTSEIINEYLANFASPDERIERLVLLEENVIGPENKRSLANYIQPLVTAHQTETAFLEGGDNVLKRLQRLADLQGRVLAAGFEEQQKRAISEALDALASRIVARASLFESILKRSMPSVDKVFALLKLCNKGILTRGEVSARAHLAVKKLMREQDFASGLTAGADGAARVEELKRLLADAGVDLSEGAGRSAA